MNEAAANWAEVGRDQPPKRPSRIAEARDQGLLDGPSSAQGISRQPGGVFHLDDDDRFEEDDDATVDEDLAAWADLRRRQGEAAAERLEKEGLDPEWLVALNARLDGCASEELVDQSAELETAWDFAHDGIATLVRARSNPDGRIRSTANEVLRDCLLMALPARRTQTRGDNSLARVLDLADVTLATLSSRFLKWDIRSLGDAEREWARHVRSMFVALLAVAAAAGAVAMALGAYVMSVGFLLVAVLLDMLEGSIGRVTATSTPVGRWASCLVGHLAEFAFVSAIASDQLRLGHPGKAVALLGAVVVAQYGTLMRTSARLVGERPSLSMKERAVRFTSILSYGTLSLSGVGTGIAPMITAIMFGGFGLKETIRVGRAMRPRTVESIVTVVKANGKSEAFVIDPADCGIY